MWHKLLIVMVIFVFLTACTPATPSVILTDTPISTLVPTSTATITFTPEPTATATPEPITGRLFFDMNGSGLKDQASFNYDPERLADERQPLQFDLAAANGKFLQDHPDLKAGDIITMDEPPLTGYTVCIEDSCTTTDAEGNFTITYTGTGTYSTLKITDPNAGNPALEMRYLNIWKKPVVIPAYEMNGVQVPEQHLNDTTIQPINNGILAKSGKYYDVGLMQGYLSLPFSSENMIYPIVIWNGYDVCGEGPYKRDGIAANYLGETAPGNPYTVPPKDGQLDFHAGLDFAVPEGVLVVASIDGSASAGIRTHSGKKTGELFIDINNNGLRVVVDNGHFGQWLTNEGRVYRGQYIASTGKSGNDNIYLGRFTPQLHWDIAAYGENQYLNPFATLPDDLYPPNCKVMKSQNLWTVYNLLVYP